MSYIILQMIEDIKSGRPVGIVKQPAPAPGIQLMYGRKDGVTMDQHLAEFNNYRDSQGRSFDQIIQDGLFGEPKNAMLPPPKPQSKRSYTGDDDMDEDEAYMHNLHHKRLKLYMVKNPLYQQYTQNVAITGSAKRKAEFDTSGSQAQDAQVSSKNNKRETCSTQLPVAEDGGARKRRRMNAHGKK
jgi:hypothetical protein